MAIVNEKSSGESAEAGCSNSTAVEEPRSVCGSSNGSCDWKFGGQLLPLERASVPTTDSAEKASLASCLDRLSGRSPLPPRRARYASRRSSSSPNHGRSSSLEASGGD